jgi:predicted RNA methylase
VLADAPSLLEVPEQAERLTHYLFRYPAKFHPPVVRALLERYTGTGDVVLDPFCGSGTLLVEAAVLGRRAIGTDVDPLAVFISRVKSRPLAARNLDRTIDRVLDALRPMADRRDYEGLKWDDLTPKGFERAVSDLWIPAIPNLFHWFRRYVIVDLAQIRAVLEATEMPRSHRDFLMLCFASILRNASNADPVPVSGLEVTAHMRRRDEAGRVVNPFALFQRAVRRARDALEEFSKRAPRPTDAKAFAADATRLRGLRQPVDAVITSPPYHGAVDYYRRHQLEMFWLGFTTTQEDRLRLLHQYVGRTRVRIGDPRVIAPTVPKQWESLEASMRAVSVERANAFRHYCGSMRLVFERLATILRPGAPAIMVVGHSTWNGLPLDTSQLFEGLATPAFALDDHLTYPVKNRYMSYSRHNEASIDREFVLVLRRASAAPNPSQNGACR